MHLYHDSHILLLLSGWIAVISYMILIGVDLIDPVIRCGRIVPMYTFFIAASAAPNCVQLAFSEGLICILPLFLLCRCVVS